MHKEADAIAKYGNEKAERRKLGRRRGRQKQWGVAGKSNKQNFDLMSVSGIRKESDSYFLSLT